MQLIDRKYPNTQKHQHKKRFIHLANMEECNISIFQFQMARYDEIIFKQTKNSLKSANELSVACSWLAECGKESMSK